MTKDNKLGSQTATSEVAATPQWAVDRRRLQLAIGEFLQCFEEHSKIIGRLTQDFSSICNDVTSPELAVKIGEIFLSVTKSVMALNACSETLVICADKFAGTFTSNGYTQ